MEDRLAILVPGGHGQLGSDLIALADQVGLIFAPGTVELDVTDTTLTRIALDSFAQAAKKSELTPVVINAAAYTAVDAAETEEFKAFAVNAAGAQNLATACAERDLPLIHISTDYVFPGNAERPYEPDDPAEPKTVYGKSKLLGEQQVLAANSLAVVVRTAWLYGATGHNFVKTMIKLERSRDTLSVVDDQVGCPTWTADLAAGLLQLARLIADRRPQSRRVLHCVSTGHTTWCGLAKAVFEELGAAPERVQPCSTADYPLPAPRPAYSVLSNSAWQVSGLPLLPHWRIALAKAFAKQRADFSR